MNTEKKTRDPDEALESWQYKKGSTNLSNDTL